MLKVRQKLDYLRSLLDDPVHFKNIYRYAFDFARVSTYTYIVYTFLLKKKFIPGLFSFQAVTGFY